MIAAFDTTASTYDDVARSALGKMLRSRVHRRLSRLVCEGDRVLDLGCGTGIDAAWSVKAGAVVTAVDQSEAMVAAARERLGDTAVVVHEDMNDPRWVGALDGHFDVVLANFGVANCVHDMALFGRQIDHLLSPNGRVVLVPMARLVPWELFVAAKRRDWSTCRRRYTRTPVSVRGYEGLAVRYWTARSTAAALGAVWTLNRCEALGWALPTYEHRALIERFPRLGRTLERVDRSGARVASLVGAGDHVILEFVRRGS